MNDAFKEEIDSISGRISYSQKWSGHFGAQIEPTVPDLREVSSGKPNESESNFKSPQEGIKILSELEE